MLLDNQNLFSPLVSVIIPTYNRAHLLPRAIDSVLQQDFTQLELIIIDDGSSDDTQQVIQCYQDARIRYHRSATNCGIGFSRQLGTRLAQGKYIAWHDSDDVWRPGKLSLQIEALESQPEIDLLFGDFINITPAGGEPYSVFERSNNIMQHMQTDSPLPGLKVIKQGFETAVLSSNFIGVPTVIFRTSLLEKTGSFECSLFSAEDIEFHLRCSLFGARIAYHEQALMDRYKDATSLTFESTRAHASLLAALERFESWCHKLGRPDLLPAADAAQQRAYHNLLWAYGKQSQRRQVWRTYRKSQGRGFSLRTLLFALSALLGPKGINAYTRLRAQ